MRAARIGRRWLRLPCLTVILTALVLAGCGKEKAASPDPETPFAAYEGSTDEEGVARITDNAGATIFVAAALDPTGTPIPDLKVTYLQSSPEQIVAFNDASGDQAYGMFAVTPSASARKGAPEAGLDETHDIGVFILNLLDIGSGHLYDPVRDGFDAPMPNTLRSLRKIFDYEDLSALLSMIPGLYDLGVKEVGGSAESLAGMMGHLLDRLDSEDPDDPPMIIHRYMRFLSWMNGRSHNYRMHLWRPGGEMRFIMIPMGVRLTVQIDAPANGQTFTGERSREVEISGRINEQPLFLTTGGGHLELYGNGALVPGALSIGGDGAGSSVFSATILLAPGENRLDVVAYAGESGWGFDTPENGEVGRAGVTVAYQASQSSAPVLNGFQNPPTAPAPDGVVDFTFTFSDPDGDIVRFHQRLTGVAQGEAFSLEGDGLVSEEPELQAMVGGTYGSCNAPLTYFGLQAGDWARQEFWVTDAQNNASNHLIGTVTIVEGIVGARGPMKVMTISAAVESEP